MPRLFFPIAQQNARPEPVNQPAPIGINVNYHGPLIDYWSDQFPLLRVGLKWPDIQPVENGPLVIPADFDRFMARHVGQTILLNLSGCPTWAGTHGRLCGYPDQPYAIEKFGALCRQVAARYYRNRVLWGIWNEPDAQGGAVYNGVEQPWFGCLGSWGGAAYADLVREAAFGLYPFQASLVAGELMLPDPTDFGYVRNFLRAGPPRFDYLSWHYYHRAGQSIQSGLDTLNQTVAELALLLDGYDSSDAGLILSETAHLWYDDGPAPPEFFAEAAAWAQAVVTWSDKTGIPVYWHAAVEGWRNCTLLRWGGKQFYPATPAWQIWNRNYTATTAGWI